MKRRDILGVIGGAAAWPLAARAQRAKRTIGFLGSVSASLYTDMINAFHEGLRAQGYVERQNLDIVYRWSDGHNDRLPALIEELVQRPVEVIAAPGSTPAAQAAKKATNTIPIVFQTAADPVKIGLVASLKQPGGNLTGISTFGVEVGQKRLELLHEALPAARLMALLINQTSQSITDSITRETQQGASNLGLQLDVVQVSAEGDFETAFEDMVRRGVAGLLISPDALFTSRTGQLARLAIQYRVPAIYQWREFAIGGGLLSYGGDFAEGLRAVGSFTGRILNGEKVAELPVQQFTRVQLIVNLKTAKKLGIELPITLLARADEVIE